MNNKIKQKKSFSIATMITTEIFIIYLVLRIGSIISMASDSLNMLLARYIPVGIASILVTYFLIRFGAKKCLKSEKDDFWKQILIAPIVVAVVIFLYGMYCVNSNIAEINKKYENYGGIYSAFMKNYQDEYQEIIKEAKKEARNTWIITSLVYLVCSGATTFCLKNKIDGLLQYDEFSDNENLEYLKTKSQILASNDEENIDDNYQNRENENTDNNENTAKNIKWDL